MNNLEVIVHKDIDYMQRILKIKVGKNNIDTYDFEQYYVIKNSNAIVSMFRVIYTKDKCKNCITWINPIYHKYKKNIDKHIKKTIKTCEKKLKDKK